MKKKYSAIICIYTCIPHEKYNLKIKSTEWYKSLLKDKNFKILFVYADNSLSKKFFLQKDKLFVKTKEDYLNLSLKTFMMIDACNKFFDFEYLIKIDASLIDYSSKNESLSFDNFLKWFEDKMWQSDYSGIFKNENVKIESLDRWRVSKKISNKCNVYKIYKVDKIFNYYSGKCYSLSFENCKKINDIRIAINYKLYIYGIEDIMISEMIK